MKLIQKLAIRYYKAKINLLGYISKNKAGKYAFKIFCTPYSGKPYRPEPSIFQQAERTEFVFNNMTIRGWKWKPLHSTGKKILIAHGFDSYSYRFEKYIRPLLKAGFELYAFDAPGHGLSDGKRIDALIYSKVMCTIDSIMGPLYGMIAHSIGGLAASLAAEQLPHLQKLVLIAPAVETTTAIDKFAQFIGLPFKMKQALTNYIVHLSQKPITYFATSKAIEKFKVPTLWLHDTDDAICPFSDVEPVRQLHLPHVQFYITNGLGHSNIYRDSATVKAVCSFIQN